MKLFDDIRNIINESNFKMLIYDGKIDLINFNKIIKVSDSLVIVKPNKKISIIGKDLKINKLLDDEIIITGDIIRIEFDK